MVRQKVAICKIYLPPYSQKTNGLFRILRLPLSLYHENKAMFIITGNIAQGSATQGTIGLYAEYNQHTDVGQWQRCQSHIIFFNSSK